MRKILVVAIFVADLLMLPACSQADGQPGIIEVLEYQQEVESAPAESPAPTPIPNVVIEEEAVPDAFVPIAVEEFGITTVVPADWPAIVDDPLLKNAWGPGEYRFVAFHTIPGLDVRPAMAQLVEIELEELLQNPPEGKYWEEQIGRYEWALYNVDSPEVGLGQSVAMTVQGGTVYIVSFFVEMAYHEAVLNAVLENFAVKSKAVEAEPSSITAIQEQDWVLQKLVDGAGAEHDVLAGTELTIVFKPDGRVSGSAGCNGYASDYTHDNSSLTITAAAKTRKSCEQPQGVMLQETQYLSNLTAASTYQIDEGRLQLLDGQGKVILDYVAR